MGMFNHWSDSKVSVQEPPNPNPYKFQIVNEIVVKGRSILMVRYDGCTTFDGLKLLLLRRKWIPAMSLDPHLLGSVMFGEHIVMARFEPNSTGWMLARMCAEALEPA